MPVKMGMDSRRLGCYSAMHEPDPQSVEFKARQRRREFVMKTGIIGILGLAFVLSAGVPARGQDSKQPPKQDNPMRAIELRHKQLDIDQRQSELNFSEQVRQIELEKKRLELERARNMLKAQEQEPGPGPGMGLPGPGPRPGPQIGKDEWKKHHAVMKKKFCGFMFVCMIVHILLAVWTYQDIRKRNAGSGVWIVVTLLTGLLGALVYAVVRMGDAQRAG